jgi:hypothetical protein
MATLLTATGYGGTGSSAVTNILEEFETVKSFGDSEFQFTSYSDGIADLENIFIEGHPMKTDLAVKRFMRFADILSTYGHYKKCFNGNFRKIVDEYIKDIISISWDGWWPHHTNEIDGYNKKHGLYINVVSQIYSKYLNAVLLEKSYEPSGWQPTYFPQTKVYYTHLHDINEIESFLNKTRKFTDALLHEAVNSENKYNYILLDQAIPPTNFSQHIRYFSDPKLIIVDRDPRDLYVVNKAYWGEGWIPSSNVELFIRWYTQTRKLRKNELMNFNCTHDNKVLFIPFESLIYEYDNSITKIFDYTGLSSNEHINKLKFFNPELSIKNTQFFLDYPELISDIKIIEQHLGDYCYDFPHDKHIITKKYFLIEDIDKEFNSITMSGRLQKDFRKYFIISLFKTTKFSNAIREIGKRKNIMQNLKLFIKIIIFLFLLPANIIYIYYSFIKCKKNII